ncbi:MAG TPA: nitroreductase family protein [Ktedonobacteraceae bacterium]|nr:nitroreductase family protein [Ktedonobacteraceae bacterium]
MSILNLSPDELLSTTRSVRKRLDFSRPVEPELIRECLELATQAPTGSNSQGWHFVVVTDAQQREALGAVYRKGWATYTQLTASGNPMRQNQKLTREQARTLMRVRDSAQYLADHMHEAPVLVVPCIWGRTDRMDVVAQAGAWGSILPAVWSFMLAARARGLGTCWTTVHLFYEQEAAQVLGIPYERVMQAALIPVAHTMGTDFKPAPRVPLESIVHWKGGDSA